MERIKKGDTVLVVMNRNNIFDWQRGPSFEAIFHHSPGGPGDTFVVEVDGQMVMVNGNSSEFIALVQIPQVEKPKIHGPH